MPRLKLTEHIVAKLAAPEPSGKQTIHWDLSVRGFGVLCSGMTTKKSYIAQRDLPGGQTRRVTVAAVSEMSLADARAKALELLLSMREGIDPNAKWQSDITLQEALEEYLAARNKFSVNSVRMYKRHVTGHLKSWLNLPLRKMTGDMVETRHREIAAEVASDSARDDNGTSTANFTMKVLRIVWNFATDRLTGPCLSLRHSAEAWQQVATSRAGT